MPEASLQSLHALGGTSGWAELREAQLLTWKTVPATGMAVAIDLGDPQDIPSANKQPVGERLALLTRSVAYVESLVQSAISDNGTCCYDWNDDLFEPAHFRVGQGENRSRNSFMSTSPSP